MSKKLATAGFKAIKEDFFAHKTTKFKIEPPQSFDFFNSLRVRAFDTFAGVTVVLVDSIFWQTSTGLASQIGEGDDTLYSGTAALKEDQLPQGVSDRHRSQWLVVASHELKSRPGTYGSQLASFKCVGVPQDDDVQNSFLMFLRAHELLSFDERKRANAEMEVAAAPDDPAYEATSFHDLLPYYERFELYEVDELSVLRDRSIFWMSYIVAAYWSNSRPRYLTNDALAELLVLYDEARWHFPIDNARTAVVASHFKHCFIELYRCLEWLYALPRAIAVKRKLNLSEKATMLARTFRSELGWRRTELDSLRLLLRDAQVHGYSLADLNRCLVSALPPRPDPGQVADLQEQAKLATKAAEWDQDLINAVADRLYKVRNQFVHQIEEADIQPLDASAEPHLVRLLCWLCVVLYRVYAPEF
jgi:hypothetical protein